MTLNERPLCTALPYIVYSGASCIEVMKLDPYYQRHADHNHKFVCCVNPNLDFWDTVFFNVKYLESGTRKSFTHNGRLIESCILWNEWCLFQ